MSRNATPGGHPSRAVGALLTLLLGGVGCTDADGADPPGGETEAQEETGTPATSGPQGSTTASDETTVAGGDTGTSGGAADIDPAPFFTAISGLWVAPVTSWTSAGSFPTMNMDVRAASDGVLFSRVDLDADNALRFAFAIETHDGADVLVFRNGGEFLGIPRDNRATLHERDGDTWRFCAVSGGCGYIDARFAFEGPDTLRLDVDVLGMRHIEWIATRREARALGGAFPTPPTVPNDAPFPPLPSLDVVTQWDTPLEQPATVWVMLSTTACGVNPAANCVPSRYLSAEAPAGATSVTLTLEQVHPGDYSTNAIIDRNQNLGAGALLPDAGDAVSLPLDVAASVSEDGPNTTTLSLWTDL